MDNVRARKAVDLFRAIVQLPDAERGALLEAECGSDVELRCEVESLLASDAAGWTALDHSAVQPDFLTSLHLSGQPILSEGHLAGGRFKIAEPLSEGGMGVVYRAVQDHPRREVALKVMRPGSNDGFRRFKREIDILARLHHPGIAEIHDAGSVLTTSGVRPYLAMELVRGAHIVTFANEYGLDVPARMELLAKVCDAVQHAHQSGVIHRDLKPDNVLVEATEQAPRPRILDFGVAALADSSATTLATEPGAVIGTVAYMAPEQANGRTVTQSDVYALGVMLYELLCGELPIDVRKDALGAAVRRIQEEAPVPISRRDPRFRGDVETILERALAKEPGRRYASADALATDIRRFLRHEPILARPASAAYILRRFARRHRLLVGVTACAALAVLGALVLTSVALVRARSAERRALALVRVMAEGTLPILTDQAGTVADRQTLAREVHTAVKSLLEQSPDDPLVLSVHSDSLRHLSRLELDAGRFGESLRLREEALAAREQAIEANGEGDLGLQSTQSIDMVLIGDAHKVIGDFAATRTWYEQAEKVQERLVERDPSVKHLEQLAWSQQRLGRLALDEARMDEATDRGSRFMELIQRVLAMRPDDLTALDGLREAQVLVASVHWQNNNLVDAADHHEQALEIGRKLVAADPHNRIYLRGLTSNLIGAFSFYEGDGGLMRRRQLAAEALPIAERFLDADPADVTASCRLAAVLGRCAEVAAANLDAELTEQLCARAIAIYDAVSSRWTTDDAQDALPTLQRMADAYHRLGRFEEAKAARNRAKRFLALAQAATGGVGN